MTRAFLALGSNLGDKRAHIDAALAALARVPGVEVRRTARFYRTAPLGPVAQDWFLNTVAELGTTLAPRELLARCQAIEQALGRVRVQRWGPRTIDLDLLWIDGYSDNSPELTLPHPGAHTRSFVLAPWRDLAPDLRLQGRTVEEWLREADPLGLEEVS